MDDTRRATLTAKYGIDRPPMDPAMNTTVTAMLAAEAISAKAHGRDNTALFDPVWSPAMWDRANEAMSELRAGLAEDRITFDTHDHYDTVDLDNPPAEAVFIWAPGSSSVLIACRSQSNARTRQIRGPDYFSSMLQFFAMIDDYHSYGSGADAELRCTINVAKGCTAHAEDHGVGTTRLMPVRRGQFLLLFRCCRVCEDVAGLLADTNFQISVLEAQSKLPPGARIDPGSPVPPRVPPDRA